MNQMTYAQIRTKVENDLDLVEETFIRPEELLGYANEAVSNIEALVHTIYEDYFLKQDTVSVVQGTADYDMPADIYANKLRFAYYKNGPEEYPMKRYRSFQEIQLVQPGNPYGYIITNAAAGAVKMHVMPVPAVSGNFITRWYLREANRFAADTDVCDIPEFSHIIIQHMKMRCYEKEGHPNLQKSIGDLDAMSKLMVETLTNMVDDDQTEIQPDLSFYRDFDRQTEAYS